MLKSINFARRAQFEAANGLLQSCGLPPIAPEERTVQLLLAEGQGRLLACAGWEQYGELALLRSVATSPDCRKLGLSDRLCRVALERLSGAGVRAVYLLTTAAQGFFTRFGFAEVERCGLPEDLRQSTQVGSGCCASASAMRRLTEAAADVRYVAVLKKTSQGLTDRQLVQQHIAYLRRLDREGRLERCGPFADGQGGLIVLRAASQQQARELASADPFVVSGSRALELREWQLSREENLHLGLG